MNIFSSLYNQFSRQCTILYFCSNKVIYLPGEQVTIMWHVEGVSSVIINNRHYPSIGTLTLDIPENFYLLKAQKSGKSLESQLHITIVSSVPIKPGKKIIKPISCTVEFRNSNIHLYNNPTPARVKAPTDSALKSNFDIEFPSKYKFTVPLNKAVLPDFNIEFKSK